MARRATGGEAPGLLPSEPPPPEAPIRVFGRYDEEVLQTVLAGALPALFLPLLLRYVHPTSFWPAVFFYHFYCLAIPAILKRPSGSKTAPSNARRSGILTVAISAVVLAGAALARAWFEKHPRLPFMPP